MMRKSGPRWFLAIIPSIQEFLAGIQEYSAVTGHAAQIALIYDRWKSLLLLQIACNSGRGTYVHYM
jgi:hypothetical protein